MATSAACAALEMKKREKTPQKKIFRTSEYVSIAVLRRSVVLNQDSHFGFLDFLKYTSKPVALYGKILVSLATEPRRLSDGFPTDSPG